MRWEVEVVPRSGNPGVKILQMFDTLETQGGEGRLPAVSGVRLRVTGVDTEELDEVHEFCEKDSELQLFTRIVREFLPLYEERGAVLQNSHTSSSSSVSTLVTRSHTLLTAGSLPSLPCVSSVLNIWRIFTPGSRSATADELLSD